MYRLLEEGEVVKKGDKCFQLPNYQLVDMPYGIGETVKHGDLALREISSYVDATQKDQ